MNNSTQSVPLQNIGRYEVTGQLGHGAMGIVYKAIDPNIGRTVALKTMRMDVNAFDHDELLRRFQNEARAAGALNHPNIVTIYDADEASGLFYIAMEFLEGRTLESILAENRMLPVERVIEITRQIVSGLDYAHGKHVVHRDIKPANILITRQGIVKIMDFGIAKAGAAMATSASSVLGTPNYMSPEQVRGRAIDGRSDLFSLGVVLYQMITGERPFAGENVTTVIYKIVNENPASPRDIDVSIHPGLSVVVTRALAKEPNDRYQNGAALLRDLENYKSLASDEGLTTSLSIDDPNRSGGPTVTAGSAASADAATSINRAAAQAAVAGNNRFIGNPPLPPRSPVPAPRVPSSQAAATMPLRLKEDPNKSKIQETVYKHKPMSAKMWAIVILGALLVAGGFGFEMLPAARRARVESVMQGWFQGLFGKFLHSSTEPSVAIPPSTVPSGSTTISPSSKSGHTAAKTEAMPSDSSESDDESLGARASRARDAMAARTGDVLLNSKPVNGVSVQIDGRTDPSGQTPFVIKGLKPGPHEFVFSLPGYSSVTRSIEVKPGSNSYTVEMASSAATLVITSMPEGASIELDGRSTGQTTPHTFSGVTPGLHSITLTMADFEAVPLTATAEAGKITSVSKGMPPVDMPNHDGLGRKVKGFFGGNDKFPQGRGGVHLVTTPPGATIFVNGKQAENKTPAHAVWKAGDYQISFRLHGYRTEEKTIHIQEGQETDLPVELRPK